MLTNHEFGPKMISVCVNLAMKVGLRASITCLKIVMDWLGTSVQLPTWTTVRTGLMRLGVAALEAPVEEAEDWIWMADHSNQIGQEKSIARQTIPTSRMNNKLGWLRKYRADILRWSQCQKVDSTALTFVNEQGLFRGAVDQLARLLESCFGLFKQLERQHSKGGFTSLLAAFGALLKPTTPESIRADFARVNVKQMRTWVSDNPGTTLASKRQTAYAELKKTA